LAAGLSLAAIDRSSAARHGTKFAPFCVTQSMLFGFTQMLVPAHPSYDHDLPREPQRRRHGAIVWRAHTEGFAMTAYRDGHAIAGISGPWSDQYVLIWWQPSQPIREVEVFDSLADAKQAVAFGGTPQAPTQLDTLLDNLRRDYVLPRATWLKRFSAALMRFVRRPAHNSSQVVPVRGRRPIAANEEIDLRGLNFRAVR
jgi:hypothetical protein